MRLTATTVIVSALVLFGARTREALAVPNIVIESACATGGSYVESGTWLPATAKTTAPGATCGSGSRGTQTASAYAEFLPTITTPGIYDVYVSWGPFTPGGSTNRGPNAENVTIRITDQAGPHDVTIHQRGNSGCSPNNANSWILVWSGTFDAGTSGRVRITNTGTGQCNNGANKRWVNADAVLLTYREPTATEPVSFGRIKALFR